MRDSIKINVDTSFNFKIKVATLGIVARNGEADVCFSKITKIAKVETTL